MKLGIVLNTSDPETAWNALRLGNKSVETGHEVTLFLLGKGVEIESLQEKPFDVPGELKGFVQSGGNLLACGTCLKARQQQAGVGHVSTMHQLIDLIKASDKVITLG